MSGIVTSRFKAGTAGCSDCDGWVPSGYSGICGVFSTSFILYSNGLPSEALLLTSSNSSL